MRRAAFSVRAIRCSSISVERSAISSTLPAWRMSSLFRHAQASGQMPSPSRPSRRTCACACRVAYLRMRQRALPLPGRDAVRGRGLGEEQFVLTWAPEAGVEQMLRALEGRLDGEHQAEPADKLACL